MNKTFLSADLLYRPELNAVAALGLKWLNLLSFQDYYKKERGLHISVNL